MQSRPLHAVPSSTLILGALLALTACIPTTRRGFVEEAARQTCQAERACDDIGEGRDWETMEDCFDEFEDVFSAAWSSEDCPDEAFERGAWAACVDDASEAVCQDDAFDFAAAVSGCRAAVVCDG